ncbi:unnamed protein product [Chironomus riparius]|uniref:Tudor domain-containing protein n=1 Tax=Chironomus riparius TaxID=315576 RepID=A0A9N9WUK5_9DIPT|nr:unnamed protein product [Chironomus riparius]
MASTSSAHNQHQIFQGDIFSGVISHVIDHEIFYVVKTESTVVLANIQEFMSNNEPSKMFWYPSINEKFLICLDNEYFRAKRVALTEADKKDIEFMQAFIIDTGETFLIPTNGVPTMNDFSMVPEEFLNVPPLAKKCKWIENTKDDKSKLEFLNNNVLKKILTFEAIKVRGETVLAKIYPYEEAQANDEVAQNFEEKLQIEGHKNKVEMPMFTPEEVKELYEEPLGTSDALIAVQGYSTNEDAQFCKFYDPNTGGCFKGSMCKLKHLPPSTDNYECRDREEIFVERKDFGLIVPQQHYDIKIMFIISTNKFIFRFIDPDYETKLEDIQTKINHPSETRNYKKIAFIPEVSQLVLVKDNDEFKRAKVINDIDDSYIIWCLDEGCLKSANMNALYDWNLRLNDPKFLTDEMEISNIIPFNDNDVKAKFRLLDFQRIKTLKALMIQTVPTLKCRLFDKESNDIGEILIKEGFASNNKFELYTDFNSNEILPI